jgi:hypothetical protein
MRRWCLPEGMRGFLHRQQNFTKVVEQRNDSLGNGDYLKNEILRPAALFLSLSLSLSRYLSLSLSLSLCSRYLSLSLSSHSLSLRGSLSLSRSLSKRKRDEPLFEFSLFYDIKPKTMLSAVLLLRLT